MMKSRLGADSGDNADKYIDKYTGGNYVAPFGKSMPGHDSGGGGTNLLSSLLTGLGINIGGKDLPGGAPPASSTTLQNQSTQSIESVITPPPPNLSLFAPGALKLPTIR